MYDFNFAPQGWQCPVCKRVYAPSTPWCYFCGGSTVTSTTTTTSDPNKDFKKWLDQFSKATGDYEDINLFPSSTCYQPKPNETITTQNTQGE